MSDKTSNAYSNSTGLKSNKGATAAAVDMITAACGAGDDTAKQEILNWAAEGDNLKNLRDKIKEAAAEE
ncbi:hypothetical protein B6N13_12705 [Marinomonas sp. UCMA 3892]|uniref:hypothetical protein n=1 Tax=Marinomonas sp. UCMA 3892 TaxID=1972585 RepID=UPI001469A1B5|nr:hypothetical protein [Marinomonas sp. UCMA 3892]NLU98940.1 hypothetical protein [Marinomonas sp. UCMA 3892]